MPFAKHHHEYVAGTGRCKICGVTSTAAAIRAFNEKAPVAVTMFNEHEPQKKSADSMMAPRYSYVKYDEQSATLQAQFKTNFESLSSEVEEHLLPGRAKALVFTKLEEAYMWIGKAIRDAQVQRLGTLDSQEERTNG